MGESFGEGIRLYRGRRYDDALAFFLALPATISEGTELAYYIGLCYARLEKYDDALLYLEQVVTSSEDLKRLQQCRLVLAILYTQTGRVRLADYELRKLLESGCQTPNVLSSLAYTAWEQDKKEDAISLYEQVLAIDPENVTALNGLGYVLASMGKDLTRALTMCKKALESSPENPVYLDSVGWVYYKLGLLNDARKFLKRARTNRPKNPTILEHFKIVHDQISDNKEEDKIASLGGNR